MANPAELLLAQFAVWRSSQTANDSADHARQPTGDGWLAHRVAVRHLEAIDQLLDELAAAGRNVGVYRRYTPRWWAIVFAYPSGWSGAGTAAMDAGVLEHLETLADLLQNYVPAVRDGGLDEVTQYADLVAETLVADDSIPESLRLHAMEVVGHLRWCVDHYSIAGDFELQDALERLAATVLRVTLHSSEENRSRMWGPVMSNWVWPFVTNIVAAIPASALAMVALHSGG